MLNVVTDPGFPMTVQGIELEFIPKSLFIAVCKDSYVVYACGFDRVGK